MPNTAPPPPRLGMIARRKATTPIARLRRIIASRLQAPRNPTAGALKVQLRNTRPPVRAFSAGLHQQGAHRMGRVRAAAADVGEGRAIIQFPQLRDPVKDACTLRPRIVEPDTSPPAGIDCSSASRAEAAALASSTSASPPDLAASAAPAPWSAPRHARATAQLGSGNPPAPAADRQACGPTASGFGRWAIRTGPAARTRRRGGRGTSIAKRPRTRQPGCAGRARGRAASAAPPQPPPAAATTSPTEIHRHNNRGSERPAPIRLNNTISAPG